MVHACENVKDNYYARYQFQIPISFYQVKKFNRNLSLLQRTTLFLDLKSLQSQERMMQVKGTKSW